MQTKISINGREVEITLTKQQVEQIKKYDQKITDRIKTFEDACEDQGIDRYNILPYKIPGSELEEAINGFTQMCIIAKSLNGDWIADLSNTSQYKYYPYFKRSGSGSALSCGGYACWGTNANCGVRLSYRDSETAEYVGKQFLSIYNKFI